MTEQDKILKTSLRFLDFNSVVIDIGAYIGSVSRFLCENSNGNPKNYYLVEACKMNFNVLEKKCPKYNLFNSIISDVTGKQLFYSGSHDGSQGSSQANSLYKEFIDNKEWNHETIEYELQSYSLDDFIKLLKIDHIGYLKINCEGGEYKIFDSTLFFLECSKCVYLQMHGKDPVFLTPEIRAKRRYINDLFVEYGYSLVGGDDPSTVDKTNAHTQQLWVKK